MTSGLKSAGVRVLGAVDNDEDCVRTMKANHRRTKVLNLDLSACAAADLREALRIERGALDILTICTPCQAFSTMAIKNAKPSDARAALVTRMGDFVEELFPRALIMENVPSLARNQRFFKLLARLKSLGYSVEYQVVCASSARVPQRRKRLVCIAVRGLDELPKLDISLSPGQSKTTVRQAFGALANCSKDDPLHEIRRPKGIVAERIRAIPQDGGSRHSLNGRLELPCHKRLKRRGIGGSTNVYGRMKWDDVSPTLTTRCTTPACGRFLHPCEDRAITLREAALLQSFPPSYRLVGTATSIERQIGNAVPPLLAKATVDHVLEALKAKP